MPLIGTAGHVDHGKSTLIQALTGRDPDRWEEEKRRGLTIDLGFSWMELPGGQEVSFVDVPGHERYLKNMLAGVEAIDAALFVVAADEGWMPQSEEHLAVLDLLEVASGVVALTKVDLVDEELAALAASEVEDKLRSTSLERAPVLPVSAVTGAGLDHLVTALDHVAGEVGPTDHERPRLWVDRSFSVKGAGTVVTGTLLGGSLQADDEMVIYPEATKSRIRGIQTHERTAQRVEPGRRVALNLAGVDAADLRRGVMVGKPGQWAVTRRFSARIRTARYVTGDLDRRGAYQIHIGSGVHSMRFVGLDAERAVIETSSLLPLAAGDRFVVRDTGRRLVVAGGRVADPSPPRTSVALPQVAEIDPDASADQIAEALLRLRGSEQVSRLLAQSGGGRPSVGLEMAGVRIHPDTHTGLLKEIGKLVARHHEAHPLREGIPAATVAEKVGVSRRVVERIVEDSVMLERRGPDIAEKGWSPVLDDANQDEWVRVRQLLEQALSVPAVEELNTDPELIHHKVRTGELVRIDDRLVFLPHQVEKILAVIAEMPDGFTVAQFRDASGLSRKYAVPILEWSDRQGITARHGDTRRHG